MLKPTLAIRWGRLWEVTPTILMRLQTIKRFIGRVSTSTPWADDGSTVG